MIWLKQKIREDTYKIHDMGDPYMYAMIQFEMNRRKIDVQKSLEYDRVKRSISQYLGEFWQHVLGDAPGWENLGIGHKSGCDLYNDNFHMYIELKNKWNTMNFASFDSTLRKLNCIDKECIGCIGIINDKKGGGRIKEYEDILVVSGSALFEMIYGYDVQHYIQKIFRENMSTNVDEIADMMTNLRVL